MKYITPTTFEEVVLKSSNLEELKKLAATAEQGKLTCQDEWRGVTWYNRGEFVCNGSVNLFVKRYYSKYYDYTKNEVIKNNQILLTPYCEAHAPKRIRKVTDKELFYIKIC